MAEYGTRATDCIDKTSSKVIVSSLIAIQTFAPSKSEFPPPALTYENNTKMNNFITNWTYFLSR